MNNKCPKCNAPLQENAQFCPHCMTVLAEKKSIEKPKRKIRSKKKVLLGAFAFILVTAIVISGVFITVNTRKHTPICSFEQFKAATPLVSERLEAEELWDSKGFIDVKSFKDENIIQYTTETQLDDAFLSVFFYNKGEEVYAYICDVAPEDFDNAEKLIKCIAISVCNNYFEDIDNVFDNEKVYPKETLEAPFRKGFTDLLRRTEQYNSDIETGARISTRYIEMSDGDYLITYCITERVLNNETLYDLALEIEKA